MLIRFERNKDALVDNITWFEIILKIHNPIGHYPAIRHLFRECTKCVNEFVVFVDNLQYIVIQFDQCILVGEVFMAYRFKPQTKVALQN